MEVSQLKVYSLGTVAVNKPLSSHVIEVVPIEDLPMTDGDITDHGTSLAAKAKDTQGSAYQVEVPTSNTIQAQWLPLGQSNRLTAPDVRRGETVVLYRFADVDKFYWTTMWNDMKLRKLETVIYALTATRDESVTAGPDSTYFLEMSTHKKVIHLHTSKADGEPFAYDIQLNTGEGYLSIQDDAGNEILLDSRENQIRFSNPEGSVIDLVHKQLFMTTPDLIDMRTKAVVIKSETYDQTAKTNTITAEDQTITAKTLHKGDLTLAGNFAQGGAAGGKGTASFNSDMDVTGDVKSKGVSLPHHTHPGDSGGTTGQPN